MDIEQVKMTMPGADAPGTPWLNAKQDALPDDMEGMSVLDVGCYNGYYSLYCASRGARVQSLDVSNEYRNLDPYHSFIEENGLDCKFRELSVYDLDELDEVFDLVIFYDVLYHLENPMEALRRLLPRVGKSFVMSTYIIDSRFAAVDQTVPMMYCFEPGELTRHDPTNVWGPTVSCVTKMLRVAGSRRLRPSGRERSGRSFGLAERAPTHF